MFHVKIEQDEDGIYVATVPALRGCVSDGRTKEEAMENVKDAIDGWLTSMDGIAVQQLSPKEQAELIDLGLPSFAARQLAEQQAA